MGGPLDTSHLMLIWIRRAKVTAFLPGMLCLNSKGRTRWVQMPHCVLLWLDLSGLPTATSDRSPLVFVTAERLRMKSETRRNLKFEPWLNRSKVDTRCDRAGRSDRLEFSILTVSSLPLSLAFTAANVVSRRRQQKRTEYMMLLDVHMRTNKRLQSSHWPWTSRSDQKAVPS